MLSLYFEVILSMVVAIGKNLSDHEILPLNTFVSLTKMSEDYTMGDYDFYKFLHGHTNVDNNVKYIYVPLLIDLHWHFLIIGILIDS